MLAGSIVSDYDVDARLWAQYAPLPVTPVVVLRRQVEARRAGAFRHVSFVFISFFVLPLEPFISTLARRLSTKRYMLVVLGSLIY